MRRAPRRASARSSARSRPFWAFVTGSLNAGGFGPNALNNTFGPQEAYRNTPKVQNTTLFAGLQLFGQVDIDATSRAFKVAMKDLEPQRSRRAADRCARFGSS